MAYFDDKLIKLKRGYEITTQKCLKDSQILYVIVNRHLGDSFRYFRALNAIKYYYGLNSERYHFKRERLESEIFKKKKLIKKIMVVTTPSIAGVAQLYSKYIDDIIILPKQDLDSMELYAMSGCSEYHNILCDANARWRVKGDWSTDEGEYVRIEMFGVSDMMWDMCLPRGLSKFWGTMSIDDQTEKDTQVLIINKQINIDKTIILCPQAQSSSILEPILWVKFVNSLKERGYKLFTNIHGEEMPIEGTEGLDLPINILVCLAKKGVRIIGVQSGLLDVLVESQATKLTVLFVMKTVYDRQYAANRKVFNEVNNINGITYLRIEHFEEDYVLKLLMDNFH